MCLSFSPYQSQSRGERHNGMGAIRRVEERGDADHFGTDGARWWWVKVKLHCNSDC